MGVSITTYSGDQRMTCGSCCSAIVWVLGIEVRLLDWHLVPLPAESCNQPPNTESCSVVECGKLLKRMSYMSSIFSSWQGGGQCRLLVSFCVVEEESILKTVQTAGTRARLRTVLSCLLVLPPVPEHFFHHLPVKDLERRSSYPMMLWNCCYHVTGLHEHLLNLCILNHV